MSDSPFILNKHMIATSKVADARKMAQDANTVTGIAINAVGRGDIEIYEMASSAIKQIANPVEAFENELGGAA